jgi:hypothetical protein
MIEWVAIRSRRDPAYWLPIAAVFLAGLMLAFWSERLTTRYLEELEALRSLDPAAAAAAAEDALRRGAMLVCGVVFVFAGLFARLFARGLREARVPPSGWWSLGVHRVAVGESARWICRAGLALSLALAVGGVGIWLAVEKLLRTFSR